MGFLCLFLQKTKLDGPFQPGLMGNQLDLCEITAKTEILEFFSAHVRLPLVVTGVVGLFGPGLGLPLLGTLEYLTQSTSHSGVRSFDRI